ncbi:nucleotide sugar dehydrogenase [Microbacterium sp. AG238]|uniref:nucleotide sugar dehydrogenase n=1 Tax=Microbacterium sp. AG238 TaxID=2183994 RepID=UPI000E7167BC|nr:nucleotide sugar dehydrogenase [Microbacterium sp. AG238]RKE59336.1 GDP-mannose 6-dehydrogenase [Microbacterium sp. AG238]
MKIAVLGLGYVGMTAAACLASRGHDITGIDPNESKVNDVNRGISPISEPGLADLVEEATRQGLLRASTTIASLADDTELAIVCVGTPSAADGSHNMSFIADVSRQLAHFISSNDRPVTVAFRSTVKPGTVEGFILPIFEEILRDRSDLVELVYNPEFLRESSAIKDFFSPPKIVVGTSDGLRSAVMDRMNEGIDAPTFYTRFGESEVTKLVDNSFHAVKTAFANEIGRVCEKLGVSAAKVHEIFIADTKLNISPYYLRPGGAFGGSCLPKDVRALQYISREVGGHTHLLDSLLPSNESHKAFLFELATRDLRHGARVVLLGLAFKNATDDLRESPNIDLARMLITAGYHLSIFDPYVHPEALVGQNLGVLSNSPFVRDLLIDQDELSTTEWDLVIDTRSIASELRLTASSVVDINRLS